MIGRHAREWDDAWLERSLEPPLDPAQPIVDAHHHLWDARHGQAYLLPQYLADCATGHRVVGSVYVECGWSYRAGGPLQLRSTGELAAVVRQYEIHAAPALPRLRIVAFADLRLGERVEEVLDALCSVAGTHLSGIRYATAFDADPDVPRARTAPPPGLLADAAFRDGVRRVGSRGLTYDVWLYHPQIPELASIAAALPDCRFVLNHLGGLLAIGRYRSVESEVVEVWRSHIAALRPHENVFVKLGGIGIPFLGHPPDHDEDPPTSAQLAARWNDPLMYAIEQLGVERCMFESNFPVDRSSMGFCTTWNVFKRTASGLSGWERDQLFFRTAARVYGLEMDLAWTLAPHPEPRGSAASNQHTGPFSPGAVATIDKWHGDR